MSRFKEGRRIAAALKNGDLPELKWAESYCRTRISLAGRKDHLKHWWAMHRKVRAALDPGTP